MVRKNQLYDQLNFEMNNMQVVMTTANLVLDTMSTNVPSQSLPIVEPFNVGLQLGVCRLNIESLTKVKYA